MIRGRAKGHKQLSVEKESRKLVANALFAFRRCGLDGPPKCFERGSLVIAQRCEVIVGVLGWAVLVGLAVRRRLVFFGFISLHRA